MFHHCLSCDHAAKIPELVTDLKDIQGKYYEFGSKVRVPLFQLDAWEGQYQKNSNIILPKIFNYLFAKVQNPYEIICSALGDMDEDVLAEKIRGKYQKPEGK